MNWPGVLATIATIAWFGGLFRVVGEVATRLDLSRGFLDLDSAIWIGLGVAVVAFGLVGVLMFAWYRRFFQQLRADFAAFSGVPVEHVSSLGQPVRLNPGLTAAVLTGGAVLALLLPGIVAAAVAVVVGVVLRVPAAGFGSSRDIQPR
jgi:hypothetical protein